MTAHVLGVSAFYHDSAAAILRGSEIIAAAQEERFTRKRHDAGFPRNAINYCLAEAFVEARDIAAIAFYDNSALTIDRAVRNFITVAPDGETAFVKAMTSLLGDKLGLRRLLIATLGDERPLWFVDHHISHAASAFYPSPFRQAAIVTVDGVGEHATVTIGHGRDTEIELLAELNYPHSLGLLYSAMTAYCGFKVNSGEYKLMGLAPYGEPRFAKTIEDNLIDIRNDGSFALNMDYFAFPSAEVMTNERFHDLFGGLPRAPETRIDIRHMDLAASVQQVTEKIMLRLARHARKMTGEKNLALAGGVALNCVANGKIHREDIFDGIWAQPAAGDAGGSLGAALYATHVGLGIERATGARDTQKGSYLGPHYSSDEITATLDRMKAVYERTDDPNAQAERVARAIADGMVVGLLKGRMEFGPRALGARSIVADPRRPEMQSTVNLKIKYRESFRPFAPAVMYDRAAEFFDFDDESPYMLMVAPVREELRLPFSWGAFRTRNADMLEIINKSRSSIPAVTHIDYSARLQTVHPDDNPDFYRLLSAFDRLTGCPVLINTSFNVRGEPIVNTPEEAYRCFMRTDIELLVLEDFLLWKTDQPKIEDNDDWRTEFELD
jgi:carbamoyltransferase